MLTIITLKDCNFTSGREQKWEMVRVSLSTDFHGMVLIKPCFISINSVSFNSQEHPSLNIRLCGYTIKMHKTEVLTIRIGMARDIVKVEVPTIFCLIFDQPTDCELPKLKQRMFK